MPRTIVTLVLIAALGACSHGPPPRRVAMQPAPASAPASASEAVWHLRAGLNVAALMCKGRGRVSVAGDYARLLDRHRGLFAAAYEAERRRHGAGFERHQTKLYNRWSNQRDPVRFCRSASGVAKRALALDSPGLSREAGGLVAALD